MTLHTALADLIISEFGEHLDSAPEVSQDALTLRMQNGLVLQARFANTGEYSIHWQVNGAELRIDTAPLHPGLSSFPNHLHGPDGVVRPDCLTRPGQPPQRNLAAVLNAILVDPLLQSTGA